MSALAQFHVLTGGRATGSDRAFDRIEPAEGNPPAGDARHDDIAGIRGHLERLGVEITPQDGSGPSPGCDALIVSTAVEESVPDVREARRHNIPILHRSELLARFVSERRSIAVTGTSGKSTVTAMIFEILRGAGRDPSVITGGDLLLLQEEGLLGNAWAGSSDWLVVEADESDGSLVRYEPWAGVLLNLQRDHKEPKELLEIFSTFRARTRGPFLVAAEANLAAFREGAAVFGIAGPSGGPVTIGPDGFRAQSIELQPDGVRFLVNGPEKEAARFEVPAAGLHNVANAVAAIAAARACGVSLKQMVEPLRHFRGVARRFQVVGKANGIEVIDDFAHNPAKIAAALSAARPRGSRILAVYQPHGYGPTRFLCHELVETFAAHLGPSDRVYMPEIFYAGGTATKDISSLDLCRGIAERGVPAVFAEHRESLLEPIAREALSGDVILVMGARDPSLSGFCRRLLERVRG